MESGAHYSDFDRETALQVWTFEADRRPGKTAGILEDSYGISVPAKRISAWSRDYDWHTQADELYRAVAPDMFDRGKYTLVAAIAPAARYLSDVAAGRARPDRDRQQACRDILDRTGFLPFTRRVADSTQPLQAGTAAPLDASELADLSLDELRALAAGALDAAPSHG